VFGSKICWQIFGLLSSVSYSVQQGSEQVQFR